MRWRYPRGVTATPEPTGFDGLDIAIDRHAEVPIGVQLTWALHARIRDGRLAPQQRLPGLRDLADALGINPNTVRAVYQRLAHQGLIETQQGNGTFVASTPPRASAADTIAARAAREARKRGVDPREVAAALYVVPHPSPDPADVTTQRRRQLRQQITALEQAVAEIEAAHPGVLRAPAAEPRAGRAGPRLLSVGELEEVQGRLVRRLADVQAAIDEHERPATPTKGQTQTAPKGQTQTAPAPVRGGRATVNSRPAPARA